MGFTRYAAITITAEHNRRISWPSEKIRTLISSTGQGRKPFPISSHLQ